MKVKDFVVGLWLYLWIRFFLFFDMRKFQIEKSRAIRESKEERMSFDTFNSPETIENIFKVVRYRSDPVGGLWDYISDPEHMYFKIKTWNYQEFPEGPYIGDCDDYAFMFAKLIVLVEGVSEVQLLSTCYRGSAHTTCLYKYDEKMYMFDYGIMEVEDSFSAARSVAERHSKDKSPVIRFTVVEQVLKDKSYPVKAKARLFK